MQPNTAFLRQIGIDYWPNEELSYRECEQALELYKQTKPKIVVSHECPANINEVININNFDIGPSRTAQLLQLMLNAHAPNMWIFGHWHRNMRFYYDGVGKTLKGIEYNHGKLARGTSFICLGELGYMDIDDDGYIDGTKSANGVN